MKPYKKYFRKSIDHFYPGQSASLMKEVDEAFTIIQKDIQFAAHSKNPIDKRLDVCGYFLATIKVLDQKGESYDKIKELLITIATDFVRPKNKLQAYLKKLPAKLVTSPIAPFLLRYFEKKASVNSNPDGFVARILTDKQETLGFGYGFDILECGICKLFAKHNSSKYASILCDIDYITSGLAGLKLIRTSTIAYGAHKCDFRFVKEN